MCPPVSPHKGVSIVNPPRTMRDTQTFFGMETPLRGRSGGHTGAAPTVSFGWITRGWLVSFGQIVRRRLVSFGWITYGTVDVVWMDCA